MLRPAQERSLAPLPLPTGEPSSMPRLRKARTDVPDGTARMHNIFVTSNRIRDKSAVHKL